MEEIKRFNKDVKENKEMLEDIKTIGNDVEKVVEYANSKGYEFTVEDLTNKLKAGGELNEDDLDDVSGGFGAPTAVLAVYLVVGRSF